MQMPDERIQAIRRRLAKIKADMEASRRSSRPPYLADHDANWLVMMVEDLVFEVASLTDRGQRHADR
jgi:alkylation response protein AidB-like acyl-CoA dehydrogenase